MELNKRIPEGELGETPAAARDAGIRAPRHALLDPVAATGMMAELKINEIAGPWQRKISTALRFVNGRDPARFT